MIARRTGCAVKEMCVGMDIYTRGLLLAGLFGAMLLLAGVALLIGRAQQRSKQAQDRFDVGKGRKRRKRKKTPARVKGRGFRGKKHQDSDRGAEEVAVTAETVAQAELSVPVVEDETLLAGVETSPVIPDTPTGPSPFTTEPADDDGKW